MPSVDRYCLNSALSWNFFLSPYIAVEGFVGDSSLGWLLLRLRFQRTSFQVLLVLRVSIEKSDVIRIQLPLYVTWYFYLELSILFFLFCKLCVSIINVEGNFFSGLFGILYVFLYLDRHLFL